MEKEPGNYLKACDTFVRHFPNKRMTDWVSTEKQLYEQFLSTPASLFPGTTPPWSFNNKRLVDIFLYTKFVHQPKDDRVKQFAKCLQDVGNPDRMEFGCYNAMMELARYFERLHWVVSNELPCILITRGQDRLLTVRHL